MKNLPFRALAVSIALSLAACGKVSPPLPPVVQVPEPVSDFAVSQIGYDLRFTWTNPSRNVDLTPSGNLTRAVISSEGEIIVELPASGPGEEQSVDLDARGLVGSVRTFTIQVESAAGHLSAGAISTPFGVTEVPGSVSGLRASVDQGRIAVEWDLPADGRELFDRVRIYRSDALRAELAATETLFEDREYVPRADYTYVVTGVRALPDSTLREGVASPPVTVTASDESPPATPGGVVLRLVNDAAFLTWDVGVESDVAGYRVFRRTGPGATLLPLGQDLLIAAGYNDSEYAPGYGYAVSAVDRSGNESERSEIVE